MRALFEIGLLLIIILAAWYIAKPSKRKKALCQKEQK
jgi:hypothetical protein